MEKLSYIKPHSEVLALHNQTAILAGSLGTSENGAKPGGNLVSKKYLNGTFEIDPASWDYALWNDKENDVDTDDY